MKVEQEEDGEGGEAKTSKGKRDKYKGGLVFEPKRGLWDRFILVMDFNSLYPSIIQEYNIDFTTVDRQDSDVGPSIPGTFYSLNAGFQDDKIPEPPESGVPQGVLPRLIATLVSRRRQVKSLMKDRSLPHAKWLQVCLLAVFRSQCHVTNCRRRLVRYQTASFETHGKLYVRLSWL